MSWWKPLESSLPNSREEVTPGFDVTAQQRDAIIESVAQRIVASGMEIPAVLLLEVSKPVSFLFSQAVLVVAPILYPFLGTERIDGFAGFINSRENIETLIRRVEELSDAGVAQSSTALQKNEEL